MLHRRQMQGRHAGPPAFVGAQVFDDLPGAFGLVGQDQLKVVAQGGFDGDDILVGDANLVREGAEDIGGGLERGQRAGAEAFVLGLQLFEDVETGALFGLAPQQFIELLRGFVQLQLNFAQTPLPVLHRAAMRLRAQNSGLDCG